MKASAFNYFTDLDDGIKLLFNFYTLNLAVLDQQESKLAMGILDAPNRNLDTSKKRTLESMLKDKGFLVRKDVNEIDLLKWKHYQGYGQKQNLSLTILPSLACNFGCVYCYQKETRQRMSPEIQEALIDFVRSKIHRGGSLSATWFGGEPLLCKDVIERLSNAFISICKEYDVKYSASIITNGYLLNTINTEILIRNHVDRVQITLDGPPDIHNKRRTLKSGGKTFQRILDNIREASKKIPISVRMNTDLENMEYISELLEILVRNGLEKRISFYLGQTSPYTEVCSDVSGYCLSDEDFSLLGLKTQLDMVKRGFSSSFRMPRAKNSYCTADSGNSYCITPSGGIVNCWNDVADPEKRIGHLLESPNDKMKENIYQWLSKDPFSRKECTDCKLLPICMGGCPYQYGLTGSSSCHGWKHHLNESLLFYYYYKKLQRENEIIGKYMQAVESVEKLKTVTEKNN